jgi:Cu2+-exporting ATPase
MDVPIVIGLLTAFVGSLVATIQQTGEVYYDSIAMFVFFVLTARFLEKKGRIKAADALDRLARVVPRTARRVAGDGSEAIVPVVDLVPGDRVRLLPGESVPADGRLLEGASGFDEALLTGESLPVARRPGDALRGGSLNVEQPCVMEVTGTGGQSALGNILRLVQRAQRDRPRVALLAERAAAWFVGVVLGIGAATALAWWLIDPSQALHNTVAVLIVTCPCALALATPAALVIAAGRFVHIGSLAVRMNAVESLARTQMLVFDKTGTLTRGRFRLEAVEPLAGQGRERVLAVAAALEAGSEHPLAAPFRPFDAGLAVSARRNHPGEGLSGVLDGVEWRLGKPEHAWPSPDRALAARIAALREGGQVVLMLADAQAPSALFLLSDTPRPGARELVERLHGRGIATAILSGDHPSHVRRLAREVGIDEAHGDLLPADKLAWVSERRRRGTRIAMVGDGINDAPTLAAADCAIALSGGTELAQTTSDYILLRDDLRAIAATHHLARRTRRVVLQNLLWAAGYNLLAIPAAALGYIPPWGAAIGMSISSLLVIGNALRLSRVHKAERLTKEGPEDEEPVPLPARLGAA